MRKEIGELLKAAGHWMVLLLATDVVFIFVTWILRRDALKYMLLFLGLATVLVAFAGVWADYRRRQKREEAMLRFLEVPGEETKGGLVRQFGDSGALALLCEQLLDQSARIREKTAELCEYQEYIEAWVHEAKSPLSLSTLVLENHKEEMSPYVYGRMRYIRHQLGEAVERILFYARLNADHSDYKFTRFRLDECLAEVLEEYSDFLSEKGILLEGEAVPLSVISDRKVVTFLLSQLIGNAVKYADPREGRIFFSMERQKEQVFLAIYNNGEGVPDEDAPFVFDKGFTGNHPSRQKATGIGLYLVKKYAKRLCVEVELVPALEQQGFGIRLRFTL